MHQTKFIGHNKNGIARGYAVLGLFMPQWHKFLIFTYDRPYPARKRW
jgi:hypothetical protein